jgi:sugar diacid utilization regulator
VAPDTVLEHDQLALSPQDGAHHGVALTTLLRSYRLGHAATAQHLAATVRTYLDENGSRGRTAKRRSIHENTVAYRLRQAEELLGRSVEKRTLELRVALTLADLVGEAADTHRSSPNANGVHIALKN